MQTLYGYPPPHPAGYGFDEGWDLCDDDDLLMSFHPHDAAHSAAHLSSPSQPLQPLQQPSQQLLQQAQAAADGSVLACGCVPSMALVTSRSAAAEAAAGAAAASAAVAEAAAGLAMGSGLGPVPSAAEAADATRLLRESLAIVRQQQHGLDPAHDQAYLHSAAERMLAVRGSPSLEHQAKSEAAAAAARQEHRDLVAAARANAVGNRRRAVVSQALHLFATDANVQGAVASLVCDEAVWRAVNSNPHVQQLLQSSGNSSRHRRPPRHDAEGVDAAAAPAGLSGSAANTDAGQHGLLSSASLRQRQTIQALPGPPLQLAAAGNTGHSRSHVMARGHGGSSIQQMDALLQSIAAMVHTLSDHIGTWMTSVVGLLGRIFGVSSAKGGGAVHGSGAVGGEEEEANRTLSYVMVAAVMVIGIIVLKRPLYL